MEIVLNEYKLIRNLRNAFEIFDKSFKTVEGNKSVKDTIDYYSYQLGLSDKMIIDLIKLSLDNNYGANFLNDYSIKECMQLIDIIHEATRNMLDID